jgi:hypothetical protein
LWEGTVHITAGSRQLDVPVTKPVDDLVIDLNPPAKGQGPATQPMVIRLLAPEGAEPTGTVQLVISPPEPKAMGESKLLRLDGGKTRVDVPVPSRLLLMPASTVGYWFEQQTKNCSATPEGELLWEVPVEPAGAFIGQVLDADGQPAADASVNLVMVRRPLSFKQPPRPETVRTGPEGRFMLTPVGYGITYVIVASRKAQFVASEEGALDAAAPLRDVVLKFPRGVSIRGRVELPDGNPAEFGPVEFGYSTPWSHSFGTGDFRTDRTGAFEIPGVNPDAPGKYQISVTLPRLYRALHRDIKPNEKEVVLQLERGEMLKGTVVDQETGQPAPGVVVYASGVSQPYDYCDADAPTNDQGEFEFTRLAPTRYSLHVRQAQVVGEATAQGGQDAPVRVQVRKLK